MIDIEDVARDVVDSAIKVHKALGPGLLESAYQQCHARNPASYPRSAANDILKVERAKNRVLAQLECDPDEARDQTSSDEPSWLKSLP